MCNYQYGNKYKKKYDDKYDGVYDDEDGDGYDDIHNDQYDHEQRMSHALTNGSNICLHSSIFIREFFRADFPGLVLLLEAQCFFALSCECSSI